MLLDLKKVFQNIGEKLEVEKELLMNDIEIDSIRPFKEPVKIKVVAFNRASLVRLDIQADFAYSRPCDRCLDEVTTNMHFEFHHNLVASLNEENNGDYIETPDFKLDLDELAITDILLQLPGKYLCSDDCKGLCIKCGQNLNKAECGCDRGLADYRLEKLKQLID